jgi:hypothetical protein
VGGGTRGYLHIDQQGLHQHGYVQGASVAILNNPITSVMYPNSLGTQWVDDWSGTSGTALLGGRIYATTNGYGTLSLPWGDVENVLRIMIVDTSSQIGLTPSAQYIMHDTTILYYKNGYPNYLLRSLKRRVLNMGSWTSQNSLVYATQESVVGIGEEWLSGIGMDVFPNPASDRIHVNATVDGPIELEIIDQLGRQVVRNGNSDRTGISTWSFDTSTWASGIYLIRIKDSSGRSGVRKVVVDR